MTKRRNLRSSGAEWTAFAAAHSGRWQKGIPIVGEANAQDKPAPVSPPLRAAESVLTADELEALRKGWNKAAAPPRATKGVKLYCYAGDRNPDDGIPVLRHAVKGIGAKSQAVKPSTLPYVQQLGALLRSYGLPVPVAEHRFDLARRWRFDFAWIDERIALELDGGLFVNGAHNRGAYLLRQMEKQNAAVLQGWRVLRYSPDQIATAAKDIAGLFGK